MTDVFDSVLRAQAELLEEVKGIDSGAQPSAPTIVRLSVELANLHTLLSNDKTAAWKKLRHAEQQRKRIVRTAYLELRKQGKTQKDAEKLSENRASNEFDEEIEAEAYYKKLTDFRDSVEKAFEASRSLLSYIKFSENGM